MSTIGFPVILGSPVAPGDDAAAGVGLVALRAVNGQAVRLTEQTMPEQAPEACPLCRTRLRVVPPALVVGRIVGAQDGRVAVDRLPAGLRALGCLPCGVVFYAQ